MIPGTRYCVCKKNYLPSWHKCRRSHMILELPEDHCNILCQFKITNPNSGSVYNLSIARRDCLVKESFSELNLSWIWIPVYTKSWPMFQNTNYKIIPYMYIPKMKNKEIVNLVTQSLTFLSSLFWLPKKAVVLCWICCHCWVCWHHRCRLHFVK